MSGNGGNITLLGNMRVGDSMQTWKNGNDDDGVIIQSNFNCLDFSTCRDEWKHSMVQ